MRVAARIDAAKRSLAAHLTSRGRGGITLQAMLGHGALRRTTGRAVTHLARRCVSSETKLTTLPNQVICPAVMSRTHSPAAAALGGPPPSARAPARAPTRAPRTPPHPPSTA